MVKEGYWYGLPLVLVGGGLVGLRVYLPGAFFLILAIFVLNFFRDPDRSIPDGPRDIVSPADGKVVQITPEIFSAAPFQRISIFMSPLDVHVNRTPMAGVVGEVTYRRGHFKIASQFEASVENEQNVFTVTGEQGIVVVKQIAGAVARRIVFWKRQGDRLARGERVGMIKFSSRVDLLLEPNVDLTVKIGDRVRAGVSVVGRSASVVVANSGSERGSDGINSAEP